MSGETPAIFGGVSRTARGGERVGLKWGGGREHLRKLALHHCRLPKKRSVDKFFSLFDEQSSTTRICEKKRRQSHN